MATVIKAPTPIPYQQRSMYSIFLAGSIDMGKAENWQARIERELAEYDVVICNPRRDDWDASWVQDISNPPFNEQVTWELEHIETADLVVFYFDPSGPAPITLLELGLVLSNFGQPAVVCCPPGYWRRGNIQMVCDRYNVTLLDTIDQLVEETIEWINCA